jgi:hypothetical protein
MSAAWVSTSRISSEPWLPTPSHAPPFHSVPGSATPLRPRLRHSTPSQAPPGPELLLASKQSFGKVRSQAEPGTE